MKEIWSKFWETCKEATADAWERIKNVTKTTWDLFKDTVITFVTGIYNWLVAVVSGVCMIVWDLIKVIAGLLYASILGTLQVVFNKIIKWITKW